MFPGCRKSLVALFDRMERGEVEEGPSFREQVELVQMHRWGG